MTQSVKPNSAVTNLNFINASGHTVGDVLLLPAAAAVRSCHIAATTVAAGESGTVLSGPLVVELDHNTSDTIAFGAPCYWDESADEVVNLVAAGNWFIGYCANPGGVTTEAKILVKLDGGVTRENEIVG